MDESFHLIDTASFDARKGFARWVLPGIGAGFLGRPQALADIWTDRDGRLMTRFSCSDNVDHFQIVSVSGAPIADDQKDEIQAFLEDKLVTWIIEDFEEETVLTYS